MNWQCLCGTYVREKRFCPRCKLVRFRLENAPILAYSGLRIGTANSLPVLFPTNLLGNHLLISGQTGTGKTRFGMKLAVEVENYHYQRENIHLLILDVEGQWKNLVPQLKKQALYYSVDKNLKINPFDLNDPALIRDLFKETLFKGMEKEYVDLSAQMNFVLNDVISKSKNMSELINGIKNYKGQKLTALDRTKTALMVRLDPFLRSPLKEIFLCKKSSIDFEKIDRQNVVVDLHALDAKVAYNSELRLIYNTITSYFLRKMLDRGTEDLLTNLFIADEAQLLVPKILHKLIVTDSWPATEFATRLRKRGCGIVLITQSPSNIEKDIFKNTGTKITFRLQHPEDIRLICDSCGFVDQVEYQFLSNRFVKLSSRQAIINTINHEPFLITADEFQPSSYEPVIISQEEELEVEKKSEKMDMDESNFLGSIETHPFISVRDRRSLLRLDSRKYSSLVDRLLEKGAIEKVNVRTGKGKPQTLYQKTGTIPGICHEYYVNWIKNQLDRDGLKTVTNKKEGPDIVIPEIKTAVEVESGKSAVISNVIRGVHEFDFVIVATDSYKVVELLSQEIKNPKVLVSKIQDVPFLVERIHR